MAYKKTIDLGNIAFDPNALWAEDRARMRALQLQRSQPKPKAQKGFWLDQISTGGGIGGALAGAGAGALAGSAVPVVGTAIGGILGALIGGGVGSAAGEIGENKITGDQWDKNVLKEGLIGGATSLPIGAGLKLARAGMKAGTGIGRTPAKQLVQEAGAQVVPKAMRGAAPTVVKNSRLGKNLEKLSGQMLNSQTQVTGSQARQMGLKPVETMGALNARTGLTNFDDMAEVGKKLTGGKDSILDTLTREAVGSTGGVKLPELRKVASQLIDDEGTLLTDAMRKQILKNVTNAGTTMYGGSKGSLSALADPQAALNQANKFRAAAQTIKSKSLTASPEQVSQGKIYDGLAKQIEDSIYSAPGVNQSMKDLSRFGATSLREMAGEARAAGNIKEANAFMKVADEVASVKDVKQLRKLKRDFVDVGKMDTVTAQADGARQFNAESASSLMKGSPIKGTLAALMNAGMPRAAGTVGKAGRALQGAPKAAGAAGRSTQALLPLAARQGVGRALTADAPVPQELPPELQAGLEQEEAALAGAQMGADPMAQMAAEEPSIGGVTKSQLEAAMMEALAAGDTKGATALRQMYQLLPQEAEAGKLNASTAAMAAKQDTTGAALDDLLQTYQGAGGGQGPVGGEIANIMGALGANSNARAYNDQVSGTARMVSRALGEVGAGSDSDAKAYASWLPRLTDPPEVAAQKIQALKRKLAIARQNTLTYGAATAAPGGMQQSFAEEPTESYY